MAPDMNRRKFLETTAASAAAFTIVPRHVLGGPNHVAPSDKINLAYIGCGTQGFREMVGLLQSPDVQIVSVCDPNKDSIDYIDWSTQEIPRLIRRTMGKPNWREGMKGIPGGREVAREMVDTFYANNRSAEKYKGCSAYADFRELLEKEKDIDAVKIMTPGPSARDHRHRGHEEGQARDGAQADRQPAGRGAAGDRDRAQDQGRHAPSGRTATAP